MTEAEQILELLQDFVTLRARTDCIAQKWEKRSYRLPAPEFMMVFDRELEKGSRGLQSLAAAVRPRALPA